MERTTKIPTICIVGRPNVGKSSLFNRLLGERRAVVVEQSGTTRDRVEAVASIGGVTVKIADTGGYLTEDPDILSPHVKEQIFRAMADSTVILMVVDSIAGLVPADEEFAAVLRKFSKDVILVANKTDNDKLKGDAAEFYRLGLGSPEPVSCEHARGLNDLNVRIAECLGKAGHERGESAGGGALKIAVVGRPNVGKSSFINHLLEDNRVIVSDMPGTTRDPVDTFFSYDGMDYILIDTAGIRHARKVKTVVDTFSMMRSRDSIVRSDVVVLLLDAAEGVTKDDIMILDFIEESGKPCLILVNKWDLSEHADEDISMDEYVKHLCYASSRLNKVPIFFVSAKTGRNVTRALSMLKLLDANADLEVSTPFLNKIFEKNDPSLVPIPRRKKRPNFLYIVQSSRRPLEFKYFVNEPDLVLPAHMNYIENQLRANLPIKGIPIKVRMQRSKKEQG